MCVRERESVCVRERVCVCLFGGGGGGGGGGRIEKKGMLALSCPCLLDPR